MRKLSPENLSDLFLVIKLVKRTSSGTQWLSTKELCHKAKHFHLHRWQKEKKRKWCTIYVVMVEIKFHSKLRFNFFHSCFLPSKSSHENESSCSGNNKNCPIIRLSLMCWQNQWANNIFPWFTNDTLNERKIFHEKKFFWMLKSSK